MKANLVIDGSIYIMDCQIKPVGFGLYWHIKSIPALEKLVKEQRIIFTNLQSKYYTGRVTIYRDDEDDSLVISLVDKDLETEVKQFERYTFITAIAVSSVSVMLFFALTILVAWLLA